MPPERPWPLRGFALLAESDPTAKAEQEKEAVRRREGLPLDQNSDIAYNGDQQSTNGAKGVPWGAGVARTQR